MLKSKDRKTKEPPALLRPRLEIEVRRRVLAPAVVLERRIEALLDFLDLGLGVKSRGSQKQRMTDEQRCALSQ